MTTKLSEYVVLKEDEGLRLQSGPGRDLIFKVTGQDTNGAFDYFTVDVAPHGGPPLHVHHAQEETIHVLKGRFKIRIGDSIHYVNEGGFAYLPLSGSTARRVVLNRALASRPGGHNPGNPPCGERHRNTAAKADQVVRVAV
jgi:Cupin domain